METEIINLWKSFDKKLEENLMLNKINAEEITKIKVNSFLGSMKPIKLFTVVAGLIWVGLLDAIILNVFKVANPFFLFSAILLVLVNKLAIGIYLYQLILLYQVDISDTILSTQEKIARLKSSTLWIARLLFLQLPVWTTFYWSKSMFEHGKPVLLFIQVVITLFFTMLALWLFFNIRYQNKDKKWFKLIFSGKEWTPAIKSMELLEQIKEYKN
jgi:hypothetical protein